MKTVLVTGVGGFIGYHLAEKLLQKGYFVIGIDSLNHYYDTKLKYSRLANLGIDKKNVKYNISVNSEIHNNRFLFVMMNLEDVENLNLLFNISKIDIVCNLAAQPGVRYSLDNPKAYIDSNIVGFSNLMECIRKYNISKFIYASSSSVYGLNKKIPFSISDNVDAPISLYAATKRSNELIAYTYSHLFNIETIGLRFFTVYGPWGRPDMAMFLFTDAILKGKSINVFNNGDMYRDFTYIDDIVEGIFLIIKKKTKHYKKYSLYNIGNGNPIKLTDFIIEIEKCLEIDSKKIFLPIQPGDVEKTWADIKDFEHDFGYRPRVGVKEGVRRFVNWYQDYYKVNLTPGKKE